MSNALAEVTAHARRELAKTIVGQDEAIGQLLLTVVCGGHALIEGVPGLAKTLAVRTLGKLLGLEFHRVQSTPDLMPADITGASVLRMATGEFALHRGPVFTDLLLVDEINRMPPRTQSALLEAMEERQVTIDGTSHPLPPWFTTFATQNPVEFEGTYPLPEAQLDRFLVKIRVDLSGSGVGPRGGDPRAAPSRLRRARAGSRRHRRRSRKGQLAGGARGGARGARRAGALHLHRDAGPADPRLAGGQPRRQPARGDRPAAAGQGGRRQRRPRLRAARRREGGGGAGAAPSPRAAARGRSRRA